MMETEWKWLRNMSSGRLWY